LYIILANLFICHGQNVTAPDGCLRHTDQLSR
jgi:hypothetical protein